MLDNAGNATFAGTAAMASSFLRNRIINGGMQIWQRGTSFSGNVYTADRWVASNNPSSVVQSSDAPAGQSLSLDITGANHLICQRIESVNAFDLASTPVVVSFWAKSVSGTNTLTVQIGTPSAVDNFAVQNVQQTSSALTLSSSWAYYTVAFSALPASASNGVFIFIYRDGSTATDRTRITGVQLEVGSAATPFERRQYGTELLLCQRYYEKSYDTGVVPGSNTQNGIAFVVTNGTTAANQGNTIPFAAEKRAAPTIATWDVVGNANRASSFDGSANRTDNQSQVVQTYGIGTRSVAFRCSNGIANAVAIAYHWTASAEL